MAHPNAIDVRKGRPFAFLVAALVSIQCISPASAQSLDGPASVCPGQRFEVQWEGPAGPGDLLTVADHSAPLDRFYSSSDAADGSPAQLQAPFQTGSYVLRYVRGVPPGLLAEEPLNVTECLGGGGGDVVWPDKAVEVRGTQTDYGDVVNRAGGEFEGYNFSIDDLCNASDEIGAALRMIVGQIEASMQRGDVPFNFATLDNLPGAPSRADIEADLREARDMLCEQPDGEPSVQPFVITYAYCRMAMTTPTQLLDIHLPPGEGSGTMAMADHATQEVATLSLRRSIEATTASPVVGTGWSGQINFSGGGNAAPRIGYPTKEYEFEYSSGLGDGSQNLAMIGNMVSAKNTGTMWAADSAPGIDIIQTFYRRLTQEVSPNEGATSFFGGLINNLVGMLDKGIPLEIDQTVSSRVMGRTMVSGRSHHVITSIRLVDFDPAWCSQSLMPAGYAVTDIDQQISEALGSGDMPSSDEMSQAMEEYNRAMEQLTPEQRAMMEQMGMGDMMQGMMGGAAGAPPAAAGQNAPGPAPAAAGNTPSSADLMADDLTQSIQNHLQALGYDPGNTDGDASLQTTIAISQFQAEKGLDVTGEVSPQLLGALAAEVDGR